MWQTILTYQANKKYNVQNSKGVESHLPDLKRRDTCKLEEHEPVGLEPSGKLTAHISPIKQITLSSNSEGVEFYLLALKRRDTRKPQEHKPEGLEEKLETPCTNPKQGTQKQETQKQGTPPYFFGNQGVSIAFRSSVILRESINK